jgi:polar amino acid transport system substrate-binding protein
MLQQGDVDAISTDDTILAGLAKQDPNLVVVTNDSGAPLTLRPEPYGIAISKDRPDLVQFVNAVLAGDRSGGAHSGWAQTYEHWLCPNGPETCAAPPPPTPAYRP